MLELSEDGLPNTAKTPNRDCRMAAEQNLFHRWRSSPTIGSELKVIWEMSVHNKWNVIMYKTLRLGITAAMTAAALSTFSTLAMADQRTSRQTLGSGPDVYRVEVRNLHRVEALQTGDSDGVGELHNLRIKLSTYDSEARNQFDEISLSGTDLYLIHESGIVSGTHYYPIRVGQHVSLSHNGSPQDSTQMWVHVNTAADSSYDGGGHVSLSVYAEELDCAGQRVCGRRGKGTFSISFEIPEFTVRPSNRCGPDNTFWMGTVDGELQVSGLSNGPVWSNTNSRSLLGGINYKGSGPILRPINAEICIASTIRP